MVRKAIIIAALGWLTLGGVAQAETLNLACEGSLERGKTTLFMPNGERERVQESVTLEIVGDTGGRIKLPRKMESGLGDSEGYLPLNDVLVTDDEITARTRITFMDKPKITLNRRTGGITVRGVDATFSGSCEKYDPALSARKF